jgi:phosphoglycerate dehydrogenase-like enzyme
MRAALPGDLVSSHAGVIREPLVARWGPRTVTDPASAAAPADALGRAEAALVVRWGTDMPPAPRLRLPQIAAAGDDALVLDAVPATVAVRNAFGHEPAIGGHGATTMLAWCHRLLPIAAGFRAGSCANGFVYGPVHAEPGSGLVLVLGTGRTGGAIGERAAAPGLEVTGVSRTVREPPRGFAAPHGLDQRDALLPTVDFVVLACAPDAATIGLIDALRLGPMRSHAVLLNARAAPWSTRTGSTRRWSHTASAAPSMRADGSIAAPASRRRAPSAIPSGSSTLS